MVEFARTVLLDLAMTLVRTTELEEVLAGSISILQRSSDDVLWAILDRVGVSRYRATAQPGIGYDELRALMDRVGGEGAEGEKVQARRGEAVTVVAAERAANAIDDGAAAAKLASLVEVSGRLAP